MFVGEKLIFSLYVTATLSVEHSADLSTVFDFGGIAGGIAAGMISDYSGMSATTCSVMLLFAVPVVSLHSLLLSFFYFPNLMKLYTYFNYICNKIFNKLFGGVLNHSVLRGDLKWRCSQCIEMEMKNPHFVSPSCIKGYHLHHV